MRKIWLRFFFLEKELLNLIFLEPKENNSYFTENDNILITTHKIDIKKQKIKEEEKFVIKFPSLIQKDVL